MDRDCFVKLDPDPHQSENLHPDPENGATEGHGRSQMEAWRLESGSVWVGLSVIPDLHHYDETQIIRMRNEEKFGCEIALK